MIKGFTLGKFLPLHLGHLALIQFARNNCDLLYVIICFSKEEAIDGSTRQRWLQEELKEYKNIEIIPFLYDEKKLPNTSVSSRQVSKAWAAAFKKIISDADLVFTSEEYGDFIAEYMGISHLCFNKNRDRFPVSGSRINQQPLLYWKYIAKSAKPWYVKKIALLGTESTGKSTLAERLANHFNTCFVPEMGREVVAQTDECTFEDLQEIAIRHAKAIQERAINANKLLFLDTDLNITKSYSTFLFNKELFADGWIEEANKSDLYLFLEPDCDFVQDGTRLDKESRDELSAAHKSFLNKNRISFISITGNWEERFEKAINIINKNYFD